MGFDVVAFFAGIVVGGVIGGYLVYTFNKSVFSNLIKSLEEERNRLENTTSKLSDIVKIVDSIYDYAKKIDKYVYDVYDNVRSIRSELDDIMVLLSDKFKWTVRIEMEGKKDEQHA